MTGRNYRTDEIIKKLREVEIILGQGSAVGEAARKIGVTNETYYRWSREYDGTTIEQGLRPKKLEGKNIRLK